MNADTVFINATSGKINIKELDSKELTVKGSSADVLINCKEFNIENVTIGTTSGDITLELPRTAEFSYNVIAANRKIKSDFPINSVQASKKNLLGQIGNKNNKGSLQVTSGDIAILKNND